MSSRAIDAEEDTIGDRSSSWILRITIETHLIFGLGLKFSEHSILVGETVGLCMGNDVA